MKCIHPIIRVYRDVMGVEHRYECPCGKCIACLHNQQDSWFIRLSETNFNFRSFVYDTLTFSPSGISYRDITEKVWEHRAECFGHKPLADVLKRYALVDKDSGEVCYLAPVVERSVIRGWIKRGRENFYNEHGYRCKIKYFIVEEYGPKTSRPHFHLLMWGLSRSDYIRFFAKPWRRGYGFTKTCYVDEGTDKDRNCIAKYVSKYVSKGVFESPLVSAGLAPKPFRSISKGIGEEYLRHNRFAWFFGSFAEILKGMSVDIRYRQFANYKRNLRYLIKNDILEGYDLNKRFDECCGRLSLYYDREGYPHALPRYYKHKLANFHLPNVLSYALQTYLLENARVHYNKGLQEFAHSLGFRVADRDPKDTYAGFGRKLFDLLDNKYFTSSRLQAIAEAKGRYIKLKNHYGRAMNLNYAYCN